jgi:DNA-binding transcriptional ArsR family regulator
MAYTHAIAALADPTRRRVFERLRRGPQPVGRIAAGLEVSRPAVSQHLRVLAGAGLVRARQEGTRRIYSVEVRGLEELRRYLDRFWEDALAAFQAEAERGLPPPGRGAAPAPRPRRRKPRHG